MLKAFKTIPIISVAFFIAGSTVRAQQVCQWLLKDGVFDKLTITDDEYAAALYRSHFCKSSSSNDETGANAVIPIDGVPAPVGITNKSKSETNICDDQLSSSETWKNFHVWSQKASPIIAKAFTDCVNAEGIQIWTERSAVMNAFSLAVKVKYLGENFPPLKVQFSFHPSDIIGKCGPISKQRLQTSHIVRNLTTFKVICELTSHTSGAEIGIIADKQVPYGNMSITPYKPNPIIAVGDNATDTGGE